MFAFPRASVSPYTSGAHTAEALSYFSFSFSPPLAVYLRMVALLAVKLCVVALITASSAVGMWAPFMCVGTSSHFSRLSVSRAPLGSHHLLLSFANCFSAGMLITMALVHFFPDAFDSPPVDSKSKTLSSWMLAGLLIPAVIERTAGGNGHGHSHDEVYRRTSRRSSLSTSTLLVLLMCFHGIAEGLLLGFEKSAESLLRATLPLSIHKCFDGVVVGVSIAKEYQRAMPGDDTSSVDDDFTAISDSSVAAQPAAVFSCSIWRPSVVLWLLFTPLAMLLVVALTEVTAIGQRQAADAEHSSLSWVSLIQALGSGSFVYVGTSILLQEEVKGWRASCALLVGVIFTWLLFALSSHE